MPSPFARQNQRMYVSKSKQEDLQFLEKLIEDGKLTPVIDRRYAVSEAPEAIRYLAEGHARGKSVISLEENG